MNPTQQRLSIVGGVAVALMLLFPPWIYFDNDSSARAPAGYHFFRSRPPLKTSREMFGHQVRFMSNVRVEVDDVRLLNQLVLTVPTFLGLTLLLRTKKSAPVVALGILLIACALVFLSFNLWFTIGERVYYGRRSFF